MNTQRRMFRGRGGPTDKRLPPKRLPRKRPQKPDVNKYAEEDAANAKASQAMDEITMDEDIVMGDDEADCGEVLSDQGNEVENDGRDVAHASADKSDDIMVMEESSDNDAPSLNPCIKEVRHLKRRVQNIRETMSLSYSISSPKTYQDNVLHAVANCVNEWRSIATHYSLLPSTSDEQESDKFYMTEDMKKMASLAVYEMIQQAIQCGPLTGSNPGYFKRCGGQVAKVVVTFLYEVIPNAPALIQCMGFTSKQMDAMTKWKKNAEKAASEDKPPSRTALKQQQGKSTGKKAKKKMKGKGNS